MRSLLLEVGTEELPARMVGPAVEQMVQLTRQALEQARLGCTQLKGYATPRRLAVLARGVPETQAPAQSLVRGPARRVAFDEEGRPTRAAEGFARSQGVSVAELEVRTTPEGGEYVFAVRQLPARPAQEVLPELLAGVVRGLQFARTMRWSEGNLRFARPIRWLVALWGDQVLPLQLDGLVAGRRTFGHRVMAPQPVELPEAEAYEALLLAAHVIADPALRRQRVQEEIRAAAHRVAGHPVAAEALVDEITHLVEYPVGLVGRFQEAYLELPREVLLTVMATHQRYVAVEDDEGRLRPHFVVVANGAHIDEELVRAGNEKVLQARLADARFFFDEDRRVPLSQRVQGLSGIVYHERLGTMAEKVQRLQELVGYLAGQLQLPASTASVARRAALLCKADLLTHMVYEFPELQGIMGREYARASGEPEEVAVAIAEHVQPRAAGDQLPASDAGALVAWADRLDHLVGFFGVGLEPTGSEDPFALRRQALGLLRITLQRNWRWSIADAVGRARELYGGRLPRSAGEVAEAVGEFLRQRLRVLLGEQGLDAAVVEAALAVAGDRPAEAAERARQ
ncbi:MAG TPA: glycine--tRNA ligase subunit beta, partial [Limnochordales bacterium]